MPDADQTENPRAVIGSNNPPISEVLAMFAVDENFSQTIADYLKEKYASFFNDATTLLGEARALPRPITSKEERAKYPPVIKRIRDLKGKFEAFHELEKAPFWRGGQACDQTFFGTIDKLMRRDKKANAGAADILGAELTDYDNRVLAEEQERRAEEARKAAAAARAAEQERLAAEAKAAELAAAAERARKPETQAVKQEAAEQAVQAVSAAKVEQTVAFQQAETAYIETLAKPADIMRDRGEDGTMSTMAQETYAEVDDYEKLNGALLWPFVSAKEKEKALRAWAKTTDYRKPMAGARVGRRNKTRVL